jgi:FdhE protein
MPTDWDQERRRLSRKLEALRKKNYLPQGLLQMVGRTAELQLEARAAAKVTVPADSELASPDQQAQGAAILPRARFTWDAGQAADLFHRLLELVLAAEPPLSGAAKTVTAALADGELDLPAAFAAYVSGEEELFAAWAARLPETPRLLDFLVSASLAPGLESLAAALAKRQVKDRNWTHGHCPVCGSLPLIARLLEKEGRKHLTCAFCHTEYRAKRLQCPFCLEEDAAKLEYFEAEEEPGIQVHVCRSCNCYLKTVDFRQLEHASLPLLDDLESIALDILAQNQGLVRPTLSAWGF